MVVIAQGVLNCMDRHRRIYFGFNRIEPWYCYWCGNEIGYVGSTVHHLDENKMNNKIENLVLGHRSCHLKWHADRQSPEKRAKISASLIGHPVYADTRNKISIGMKKAHAEGRGGKW